MVIISRLAYFVSACIRLKRLTLRQIDWLLAARFILNLKSNAVLSKS